MSEPDYTTYILSDDIQEIVDDNDGQAQVVYIQGLTQEDIINGVTVENVEYADTYEVVDQVPENTYTTISSRPTFRKGKYDGNSGYWSEEDVHRLLKVYLKIVKKQPLLKGKPNMYTWDLIILEFDESNKFSRTQVKSKIARLRKFGQEIERNQQQKSTKWPFWKAVSDILQMERAGRRDEKLTIDANKRKDTLWTNDEVERLLVAYRKHLGDMVQCSSNVTRRIVWNRIAESLNRPRYQVSLKFQSLKAKWRRWKRTGLRVDDTLETILNDMNKVMAMERICHKKKRCEKDSQAVPTSTKQAKVRSRWSADCSEIVLKMYEEKLQNLKSTGSIITRRSIYKQIADEIKLPLQLVQVKIASAKGHYKKVMKQGKTYKRCNWHLGEILKNIVELEKLIWLQFDDDDSSNDEDKKTKHFYQEPSWFRDYRKQVESRHKDKVHVLERLLSVLETIARS